MKLFKVVLAVAITFSATYASAAKDAKSDMDGRHIVCQSGGPLKSEGNDKMVSSSSGQQEKVSTSEAL